MRWSALTILVLSGTLTFAAAGDRVKGRIIDAETGRGIENLLVALVPPTSASTSRKSTLTDYSGAFHFDGLSPGKYLLEASEGPYLVYRKVIDTTNDVDLTIRLESSENQPSTLAVARHSAGDGSSSTAKESNTNPSSTASSSIAPKVPTFKIDFEHQIDKNFSNLHTLIVTRVSGNGGFDSNPNHMLVELVPTGTTELRVVNINEQQMELHFIAAADYKPTGVLVTIYDSSNLDTRQPKAIAQAAPAAPARAAADPNKVKIDHLDTVFLQRSQGNGRVRIYGSGFGSDYSAPPYPVDDYLYSCLQREDITRNNPYPKRSPTRTHDCAQLTGNEDDFQNPMSKWRKWRDAVRQKTTVALNSRNTDLRIERIEIMDINDSYIDAYFEFTRFPEYSLPFRLGGVTVIVQTSDQRGKTSPSDSGDSTSSAPKAYVAYRDVGNASNASLSYRYTVLDKNFANTLLGKGIAENFYVLQVAMVNSGTKKVMVPLAGIQAEVEWARGSEAAKSLSTQTEESEPIGRSERRVHYLEGPPTVTPARLAAVSAHFDAFQKSKGRRAIMFNVLDGLTTFGAALVPFAGPSLQDAHTVVSGGFIPGLHKAVGDLSSQQLQNLTALSWQDTESIAPGGGSIEKLIYIQRSSQFAGESITVNGSTKTVVKQITNLMDLDITGYEVNESTGRQATSVSAPQSGPSQGVVPSGNAP